MKHVRFTLVIVIVFCAACQQDKTPVSNVRTADLGTIVLLGTDSLDNRACYDVWGYVDAVTQIEYALVGHQPEGLSIVNVSNPAQIQVVSYIDSVPGFDLKTWDHYVYTVTGSDGAEGAIVDISNPATPRVAGTFPSAHNIFISDSGYLVAARFGLRVYSLEDPENPLLIHESGEDGHDVAVIDDRLYEFQGGWPSPTTRMTNVYGFENPANPTYIASVNHPQIDYHHSGWVTDDHNTLLICNELAGDKNPDIFVFDISNLDNPQFLASYTDEDATVHNVYIIDQLAYVSFYSAGLKVFDVSDPANFSIIDSWDTSDSSDIGFDGAFGVYPFSPSGNIYVSDRSEGLLVFRFDQ